MAQATKNPKQRLICLCNAVPQDVIEEAIRRGCNSLGKLFDATTAGCGPCGGTCQPTIRKMLDSFQSTGKFPDNPRPPSTLERSRGLRRK